MNFYIYTDGHHPHLWSFDELLLTLDEDDGEGIRLPNAMTEEEFLTHLALQENQTIQYWFYNSVWHDESNFQGWLGSGYYAVWHTGDIQLYNENHRLFGCVDGHEEYLKTITENQKRLENCYCMADLVYSE